MRDLILQLSKSSIYSTKPLRTEPAADARPSGSGFPSHDATSTAATASRAGGGVALSRRSLRSAPGETNGRRIGQGTAVSRRVRRCGGSLALFRSWCIAPFAWAGQPQPAWLSRDGVAFRNNFSRHSAAPLDRKKFRSPRTSAPWPYSLTPCGEGSQTGKFIPSR